MKNKLAEMYLDWCNNFISLGGFMYYYKLEREKALRVIHLGKRIHENRIN